MTAEKVAKELAKCVPEDPVPQIKAQNPAAHPESLSLSRQSSSSYLSSSSTKMSARETAATDGGTLTEPTTLLRVSNSHSYGYGMGGARFAFEKPYAGLTLQLLPEFQASFVASGG